MRIWLKLKVLSQKVFIIFIIYSLQSNMKANISMRKGKKRGVLSSAVLAALLFTYSDSNIANASYLDEANKSDRENSFFTSHPIRQ